MTLHYLQEGQAASPTVVFLHALGTDLHLWDDQAADFARDHRVVRIDAPGHGLSDPTTLANISLDTMADGIVGVLDAAGIDEGMLVGTSMGAVVALATAARHPARVTRLVLCGARLWRGAEASHDLRTRARTAGQQGLKEVAATMLRRWFPADAKRLPPGTIEKVAAMLDRTDPAAYAACAAALSAYDLRPQLEAITCPVLLVAGSLDEDVPTHFSDLAAGNDRVGLACLDGIGHFPNLQDATGFNRSIRTFSRPGS